MAYQFSTTPLYVREGDYIQFRYVAPPFWEYTETITVTIGDLVQYWLITTVPEDFEPDPFPFLSVEDAEQDTLFTYGDGTRVGEEIITITGLTPTTQAPVVLGANINGGIDVFSLRIDFNGDGTWGTGDAETDHWIQDTQGITVENGARIQIRGTSLSNSNKTTRLTLVVGSGSESWDITTASVPQNIPDPFPNFDDLNGQPTNTIIYSNIIRIQGLNTEALVSLTSGAEFAISDTNTTFTDDNGFDVLSGVTFSSTSGNVTNGQYLQLRITSSSAGLTPVSTSLSIGDAANESSWQVTTGVNPSTTPNSFFFPDITNAIEDLLIASEARPLGGIQGLGTDVEVPVTLLSTTSSEVKVKVNDGSIGVFPATVKNGDTITLYAKSSANFSETVETEIQVGTRVITTWQVTTSSGPDTDALFNVPADRSNVVPLDFISSSVITITDINRPITIDATNGALISIDYDTAVEGPRTFDPSVNSTFYLTLQASGNLLTTTSTTVTVGDGTTDNPFTWSVTTYATAPPPSANLGVWYSKKTEKFDGYPIGTILPVFKEAVSSGYGDLGGDLGSRYAGFIECDGREVSASQYWALFDVIGNTYGGSGSYDVTSKIYSGNFKLPDYRNRRLTGTGFVNASSSNSAFLPITSSGGDIFKVGSEGGYWYFDRVDVSETEPLEQVEGTGNSGVDSQFFSIGTVRVTGLETATTEVSFTIVGQVTAQVGPLGDVIVQIPLHDHFYISAVVDSEDGDPLIPWTSRMLFGILEEYSSKPYDGGDGDDSGPYGGAANVTEEIEDGWKEFIQNVMPAEFRQEIRLYDPAFSDIDVFVAQLPTTSAPLPGTATSVERTPIPWMTHWPSPGSVTDFLIGSGQLQDTSNTAIGGGRSVTGVIDTESTVFRIDNYVPPSGSTRSHSHYLTLDPVSNEQTDYSGGNFSGAGVIGAPYGSGLGNGTTSVLVTFTNNTGNTESDVFMELTEGVFTLQGNIKSPVPDVALAPQRQVPIFHPFHKTKYVIKAY